MVVSAKEEQRKQPDGSHFRSRVRGPLDAMRIVKIDTRTGKGIPWKRSGSKFQS